MPEERILADCKRSAFDDLLTCQDPNVWAYGERKYRLQNLGLSRHAPILNGWTVGPRIKNRAETVDPADVDINATSADAAQGKTTARWS
jgi:hypothetical protein